MHEIEPYYNWLNLYDPAKDDRSPFHGKEYNYDVYSENIYGYYIDPAWDFMGSETLYMKMLYVDYELGYVIMEFIGEWNDAINNDIMHLKRNIVDHMSLLGITQYILIGENVLNFHGSDDSYYEEWFEDVDEVDGSGRQGWIAAVSFHDHVIDEMQNFNVDSYVNMGGTLQIDKWRTLSPQLCYQLVSQQIQRRLSI
jgi:hypothetical protein